MPETVRTPKFAFTAVSTVLLLGLSGCAPYEEAGLCTYLFGCGSDKTPSDPGLPHSYGTIDVYNDDTDSGDDGMGADEENR